MAAVFNVLAAVFVVVVAFSAGGVSAQTHHVVGGDRGWGPDLDVSSWLSGRVFMVGDKIWFKHSGTGEDIVELQGPEEFVSCNLTNPIRMYTDPVTRVPLEKEGMRYFTSGNLESCKNGLKLPVTVRPPSEFGPPEPVDPPTEFGPPEPVEPSPEHHHPPSEYGPPEPVYPPPEYGPPEPVYPPPEYRPPPPRAPSAAARLNVLSVVVFVGLLICYIGM